MENKTHWKRLVNLDYLGVYSLEEGNDMNIKIVSVSKENVKSTNGKQEELIVARLENKKPMIINRTNAKTIQRILGTPYIEEWSGKTVTVYADTTKMAGDIVECLRIRSQLPIIEKEELTPIKTAKWQNALSALKNGKSIQDIQKHYKISTDNIKLLENESI